MRRKRAMVFTWMLGCLLVGTGWAAEPAEDDAVGQGPWVTSIAPLGDQGMHAVATAEGLLLRESTVYLISADAPQTMRPLYQHAAGTWAVAASPDGKRIASTDYRGNLVVYDVAAGKATTHEGAMERWTRALAFSPDGSSLVGGNEAGKVIVWSVEKGAAGKSIELDAHAVMDVAFSPDGQQLAVTDGGGHLHLLKWPSMEEAGKSEITGEAAWSVAFVAPQQVLVGTADNRVFRSDVAGEAPQAAEVAKGTDWITDLAVSDGSLVAAAQLGGSVRFMDASGKPAGEPVQAPSGVWSLCWAGNGKLLVGTRKHGVQVLQQSWAWSEPSDITLTAEAADAKENEAKAAAEAKAAEAKAAEAKAAEAKAAEAKAAEAKAAEAKAAEAKAAEAKAAEAKAAEAKAAEAKAAEAKAAEAKAAEAKAAEAKAAEEKPAEEKPAADKEPA